MNLTNYNINTLEIDELYFEIMKEKYIAKINYKSK